MARRNASLKPHLNQIRTWVSEGVTDIWIAHQLGSTPASIASFRRQHGLTRGGQEERPPAVEAAGLATAAPLSMEPDEDGDDEAAAGGPPEDGAVPAKRRRRGRRGGRGRRRGSRPSAVAALEHGPDGLVVRIPAAVLEDAGCREAWAALAEAAVEVGPEAIALRPAATGATTEDD